MKWFWWVFTLLCFAVLDLVLCSGVLFGSLLVEVPFRLTFGWIGYLWNTLPQVEVSGSGVATAAVALAFITLIVHRGGVLLAQRNTATGWSLRKSLAIVSLVMLAFVAGLCGTAVVHQAAWLTTSPEPLVQFGGQAGRRSTSKNHLKQIGIAIHNYHDAGNQMPIGVTYTADGTPLHSWLTRLLTQLEQGPLAQKIRRDLPWNHPANAQAIRTPIETLFIPGVEPRTIGDDPLAPAASHYAGSAWLFGTEPMNFREITDGTSSTLMTGEASTAVKAWGDPTNLRDPTRGLNALPDGFNGPFTGGVQFGLADGSVRFLSEETDPQVLRALSTPSGGDFVGDF